MDDAYVADKLGDRAITVAVTPTGYADAVHDGVFVRPHEERMRYTDFVRRLHTGPDVHYVQLQNSNLTTDDEFAPLLDDVGHDLPFATEALGPTLPTPITLVRGKDALTACLPAQVRRPMR